MSKPKKNARTAATDPGTDERGESTPILLNAAEAARTLAISERLLWTLSERRAVPTVRIGRRRLYPVERLETWISAGCPTTPGAADRLGG